MTFARRGLKSALLAVLVYSGVGLLLLSARQSAAFNPSSLIRSSASRTFSSIVPQNQDQDSRPTRRIRNIDGRLWMSQGAKSNNDDDDDDGDETPENPYADPNYPDLEFVNYADPEYVVDQGVTGDDEFFDTEEAVEAMREERRKRNDEYQFQTYFQNILDRGESDFFGEWTVYKTSTFVEELRDDEATTQNGQTTPKLVQVADPLTVVSKGVKEILDQSNGYNIENELIRHVEMVQVPGDADIAAFVDTKKSPVAVATEQEILGNTYWPRIMKAEDFRGHQGNMVCGNAWTICTAVPLHTDDNNEDHVGPFAEYRAEVGIQADGMRFRIKLDYSVKDGENDDLSVPPLRLKSMTVCRETKNTWPRLPDKKSMAPAENLFGVPGAEGGLYDPPLVGTDEQAMQYMMLDLEGGATVLFPFLMDQDPEAHNGGGWVTSLDWSDGTMRYQVDRKVNGGKHILGLRTLELSEVQREDAAQYRPKDGGQNMRQ